MSETPRTSILVDPKECIDGPQLEALSEAYLKDIVYLQGNIAAWRTARKSTKAVEYGDRAKYDISNNRHTELLEEYGVIPGMDDSGDKS